VDGKQFLTDILRRVENRPVESVGGYQGRLVGRVRSALLVEKRQVEAAFVLELLSEIASRPAGRSKVLLGRSVGRLPYVIAEDVVVRALLHVHENRVVNRQRLGTRSRRPLRWTWKRLALRSSRGRSDPVRARTLSAGGTEVTAAGTDAATTRREQRLRGSSRPPRHRSMGAPTRLPHSVHEPS